MGVHEIERGREGVALLMNSVWNSTITDFGNVRVNFKFSRVKVCVGCVWPP